MSTKTATKEKKAKESVSADQRAHYHHLLHQMILIRRYEEKAAELYQAAKIRGFRAIRVRRFLNLFID